MSNRLATVDRIPLIPNVEAAGKVTASYLATRAHAEQVIEYGRMIGDALRGLWRAIMWIGERVDEADAMRELSALNDRMLADIGLKRGDIPLLCQRSQKDDVVANGQRVAA